MRGRVRGDRGEVRKTKFMIFADPTEFYQVGTRGEVPRDQAQ